MTGLDWEKLNQQKSRLDSKLSKSGGGTRAKFWKPEDGENRIRIMTGWTAEGIFAGQFWREVGQHWNVAEDQKGPVLCPKNTPHLSGPCPICQFVEELKKDKGDVRAQEASRDLRAKTAFLLNVVDRKDATYTAKDVAEFKKSRPDGDVPFEVGDVKVQVYACPPTVFNQVLSTIQVNGIDVTDPEKGHDVIIRKSGKGLKTRYETNIVIKSPAAPEVDSLPDLGEVGFDMTEEDLLDLLSGGVGSEFSKLLPATTLVGAPSKSKVEPEADSEPVEDLKAKMTAALKG